MPRLRATEPDAAGWQGPGLLSCPAAAPQCRAPSAASKIGARSDDRRDETETGEQGLRALSGAALSDTASRPTPRHGSLHVTADASRAQRCPQPLNSLPPSTRTPRSSALSGSPPHSPPRGRRRTRVARALWQSVRLAWRPSARPRGSGTRIRARHGSL